MKELKTLGELKSAGYKSKPIKEEIRSNLIQRLQQQQPIFNGIIGYDETVIPDVERALLSKHNILFLGLRGQAKTRMARQLTELLDEYIPVIAGSDINDDPFNPISSYGKKLIAELGDNTPIEWLHRKERYAEKLATPDVSVADLIGDIDPIKAANKKISFSDEEAVHYGIIPRSNRHIFVINELPDLQARIQVSLFNILEEGDIQIRGFKVRMPLDILFVFTANPEDYTNRGSIVTPLKDRIESQILTHYPKTLEETIAIAEQETQIKEQETTVTSTDDLIKRLIGQIAIEARSNEYVDKKSGVSARLTIAAYENAVSAAERRALINKETSTQIWISDLTGIIPAVTGKIELVYEGEQEGPYQVAMNLLEKAIRTQFIEYFPDPELSKKRKGTGKASVQEKTDNPYQPVINWFAGGNDLALELSLKDEEKLAALYQVDGLHALVKRFYPQANERQTGILMEFVLHGLASYSLINKRFGDTQITFNDLFNSMLQMDFNDLNEEDFDS